MTNIDFLKKHSYDVKSMDEEQAKQFIIKQGTNKVFAYKYMKQRARYLINKDKSKANLI